jgi:hypothetical protein
MRVRIFLVVATILSLLVVLLEVGAEAVFPVDPPSLATVQQSLKQEKRQHPDSPDVSLQNPKATPPGLGIPYLALLDGLVLLSLSFMTLASFTTTTFAKTELRVQNVVMLVGSLLDVILAITLALLAFAALIGMVTLFLAAPFGTVAYLVAFGFFNTGRAVAILSFILLLKLAGVVLLLLAGQWNRRLLVLLGVSLLNTVIVSFLQGFPPAPLVSILDALAAMVVAIIALIMALPMLVGSVIGVVKSLRV